MKFSLTSSTSGAVIGRSETAYPCRLLHTDPFPTPGSAIADLSPAIQAETRGFYNWSSATSYPGFAASLTEQRPYFDPPAEDDYAEGFRFKYPA